MKTTHIIIIAVIAVAVVIGLSIGLGMRGFTAQGNVGVVEIEGTIISSKEIVENIKMFSENSSIQAIIIRVNSPGGIVAAAQEIHDQIVSAKEKKKIVVSMGVVAASGGYYVSLPADIIVANPGTVTGSIGVIMELPIIEDLLNKIGVDVEVIKSKEYKDIGAPYRRMGDTERELLQDVVMDIYDQFVETTAKARNLPEDSVLKFADGRIITGKQAKEIGLVDTLGSFEEAIKIAGSLVGIEKPRLVYPPEKLSLLDFIVKPMEHILTPKIQFLWR